jgi:hypothetical protein
VKLAVSSPPWWERVSMNMSTDDVHCMDVCMSARRLVLGFCQARLAYCQFEPMEQQPNPCTPSSQIHVCAKHRFAA